MVILIFGGTGQLGTPIAKALLAEGYDVIVTGRRPPKDALLAQRFIRFIPGEASFQDLPACDVVVNCIGIIAESGLQTFESIHYGWVSDLLKAQRLLNYQYLVQVSALGADANHPSRFLSSKGRADGLIQQQLRHFAIIRPSIVLTPGTQLIRNLFRLVQIGRIAQRIPMVGNGLSKVQPIRIEDLRQLIVELVKKRPGALTVNAVGPKVYTLKELAEAIANALKVKPLFIFIPTAFLYPIAFLIEKIAPTFLSREHLLMLAKDNTADPGPITTLLEKPLMETESFISNPANY